MKNRYKIFKYNWLNFGALIISTGFTTVLYGFIALNIIIIKIGLGIMISSLFFASLFRISGQQERCHKIIEEDFNDMLDKIKP